MPYTDSINGARNTYLTPVKKPKTVSPPVNNVLPVASPPSTYRSNTVIDEGAILAPPKNNLGTTNTIDSTVTDTADTTVPVDPNAAYADMLAQFQTQQQALLAAQRAGRIAGLDKAKNAALGNLSSEEATIDPYYYDKRNQAAAGSDVAQMNFAQYMAGRGIKGAAGAMPEIYSNTALQNRIGTLDAQQAAEVANIAQRRSGIQNAYESDLASANADIEAQGLQNYINQMNTVNDLRAADLAAQGKTSTGAWTLAGTSQNQQNLANEAHTIATANYADIAAEIDRRKSINPNDPILPYLQAERQDKIDKQAAAEAAAAKATSEEQQQAWNNAVKIWQTNGTATADIANILGVPVGARTADYDISSINAATSRMNANTSASNTAADNTRADTAAQETSYNNAIDAIDKSMYLAKDSITGTVSISNPTGLRSYIISLNLPDDYTDKLLSRYGLPIN